MCGDTTTPWVISPGNSLDRCRRCGHLTRSLAAAPAAHRDLAYGGEPTLDRIRLALTYRAMVAAGRPTSVFEVGYGTGSMLRRFLDDGARVSGADPDQLGLAVDPVVQARGMLHPTPVEDVPADSVDVDLVFGIHVLEHVIDPAATLGVAFDLLNPGGQVQFFTPAGDSIGPRWYGSAWWMLEDPTHVRFFTADSGARALQNAGFVDVEVRRPVLDSITTDVGSLARKVLPRTRPRGVLGSRTVLGAAAATAPIVIAGRAAYPPLRPTLQLIARKPR